MKLYRVAIIGTGAFASYHMDALRDAGDRVNIIAAANLDAAAGRAFCEKYNIPAFYESVADMLAEQKPDLVHICTPPGTHADLSIQCLEAGAHVLCEKPLCASLAEFDRLQAAETRSGNFLSNVFQWRFGSAAQHVKRLIASGACGKPMLATCLTLWYRDMDYYNVPWRSSWSASMGGTTTGHGIHLTDLMFYLMGDWREVQAMTATLNHPIEVDDLSMALVKFESGAFANIISSAVSPHQETYLRLDFQRATLTVKGVYSASNENWAFHTTPGANVPPDWSDIAQNVPGTLSAQVIALLNSLDRGERPLVSGAESRRIIEYITGLYQSAFTGKTVQRAALTPNNPFYHSMTGA